MRAFDDLTSPSSPCGPAREVEQSDSGSFAYPSLRAKRSNPGFRCRPPADLGAPRLLPQRIVEAAATPSVLGTVSGPSRGEMDCFAPLAMTGSAGTKSEQS